MRLIGGIILLVLGIIVLLFGDREFGAYGPVSKWLFNPPTTQKVMKVQKFVKKLLRWILGAVFIWFGFILVLAK